MTASLNQALRLLRVLHTQFAAKGAQTEGFFLEFAADRLEEEIQVIAADMERVSLQLAAAQEMQNRRMMQPRRLEGKAVR